MSDNARLEGVVGSGAAQKRGAGTVSGARTPPPRKAPSAAPGSPPSTSAPAAPAVSGGGPSAVGRHAAARAGAKELMARQAGRNPRQQNAIFELPPVFEAAVARQVAFFKRVFSPEALFEPLPPALRLTLSRNFSFFTRIFTQFIDPSQQKEVRQAIPGLARRQ